MYAHTQQVVKNKLFPHINWKYATPEILCKKIINLIGGIEIKK